MPRADGWGNSRSRATSCRRRIPGPLRAAVTPPLRPWRGPFVSWNVRRPSRTGSADATDAFEKLLGVLRSAALAGHAATSKPGPCLNTPGAAAVCQVHRNAGIMQRRSPGPRWSNATRTDPRRPLAPASATTHRDILNRASPMTLHDLAAAAGWHAAPRPAPWAAPQRRNCPFLSSSGHKMTRPRRPASPQAPETAAVLERRWARAPGRPAGCLRAAAARRAQPSCAAPAVCARAGLHDARARQAFPPPPGPALYPPAVPDQRCRRESGLPLCQIEPYNISLPRCPLPGPCPEYEPSALCLSWHLGPRINGSTVLQCCTLPPRQAGIIAFCAGRPCGRRAGDPPSIHSTLRPSPPLGLPTTEISICVVLPYDPP